MRLILLVPLVAIGALAQTGPAQPDSSAKAGFSTASMDLTANPCVDFYQYTCGTWVANSPIPADQSSWDTFGDLADRNRVILREILVKPSVNDPKRSAVEQKIGDFYASCMDQPVIDRLGTGPLEPDLKRIDAIRSKDAIPAVLARLHLLGVEVFFYFSSEPDAKNSTQMIAGVDQGGLG